MIKKFLNVFKTDKSKLTMEELQICQKIQWIAVIIFIISTIFWGIGIILVSKGISIGYTGVVAVIIWTISLTIIAFNGDPYRDIQKLENAKKNSLKAKNIVTLIKEGKFDEIYCKDKDINKLLLDISLEEKKIEISIKEDNIVVRTAKGIEIPLSVENVNDYFGMY